jgi:subtilisin family serine protease
MATDASRENDDLDPAWWREETLRRRSEVGDIVIGERCLYRPGQLVLSHRAASLLEQELVELRGVIDDSNGWLAELGLQLWRVVTSTETNLVAVAANLHARALALAEDQPRQAPRVEDSRVGEEEDTFDDPIIVSLNHVAVGSPHPIGGPAGPPSATTAQRFLAPAAEGTDCDIAILDTGVPARTRLAAWHLEIEDSVRRNPGNPDFPDDDDTLYVAGTTQLRHEAGHGTFICGLVNLVAPDLVINAYAVLDPDGVGDDVAIADAIRRVASRPAAVPVINLSLGGYTFDDNPMPVIAAILGELPRTTVVVAAAGNFGSSRPFWPAAGREVVSVGAFDDPYGVPVPTPWSNVGPWVDVLSLGQDLLSTYVVGDYPIAPGSDVHFPKPHPFARWSGTSFAAPLVAAEIARRVREDLDLGTSPTGPLTADAAWRQLQAELDRLSNRRMPALLYWPPIDPRAPRQP